MKDYSLVFVILVYRNYNDLEELLVSIREKAVASKAIIVDAFYSNEVSEKIKEIANSFDADYLSVPNNGYSFGNNIGIRHAINNYNFDSLIVSNPDIIIESLPIDTIKSYENCLIGPKVINKRGKNQNPMYYGCYIPAQKLIYKGLKSNNKILFYLGLLINKIIKALTRVVFVYKDTIKVYQLHGSFIIIKRSVLEDNMQLFDENMFLFAEESYLAIKMKQQNIKSIYDKRIVVKHKEDGSMKFRNDINEKLKESNIYVYEKYYHFGE